MNPIPKIKNDYYIRIEPRKYPTQIRQLCNNIGYVGNTKLWYNRQTSYYKLELDNLRITEFNKLMIKSINYLVYQITIIGNKFILEVSI